MKKGSKKTGSKKGKKKIMANETTSTSLSKLYTNKVKTKGTYRVYKPKPLMGHSAIIQKQASRIRDTKSAAI